MPPSDSGPRPHDVIAGAQRASDEGQHSCHDPLIRRRYCTGPGTSNSLYKGAPHPLAALRMTAEWETEQRLQRAVESTAIAVAQAAVAGAARIDLTGDGVDVELIARRVGNLGVRLRTEATTAIELVGAGGCRDS